MDPRLKELVEASSLPASHPLIQLSSSSDSDSDSDDDSDDSDQGENDGVLGDIGGSRAGSSNQIHGTSSKKRRIDDWGVVLPVGFLQPLPLEDTPAGAEHFSAVVDTPEVIAALPAPGSLIQRNVKGENRCVSLNRSGCKQFWKAGDYEGAPSVDWDISSGGMDHVRVHPKFLHSNATSHKWALGAFAELLDNALDEVCNGATYVNVDMLVNKKDGSKMLLVEDNGGGMDPDKMRQCMSLGYSAKSKVANTIGQYGNGFKTSTMRLGADVIVFSRCCGQNGKGPTQSIGLLSYTFLRNTGKEDIVVPMLDYKRRGAGWGNIIRSSPEDWDKNVETMVQWSPFSSEAELLSQFNLLKEQGTRIIIYNLWEDDQGLLELDFNIDPHDIQIRGVNRDEKNVQMAKQFPNSRHFLTYRHSLRSYTSILYLRLPPGFRIILRGRDVEHHNIVNDMMMSEEVTYRPKDANNTNVVAVVTLGFVKDAKHHIDVQGFNVYHKNRLIKPFWRLWNAAGSDGRGVIGVLEANFVEPAHDKQGFERTTVLSRLEAKLIQMQKNYWCSKCHKIGYAPRRNKKAIQESRDRGSSPDDRTQKSPPSRKDRPAASGKKSDKFTSGKESLQKTVDRGYLNGHGSGINDDIGTPPGIRVNGNSSKTFTANRSLGKEKVYTTRSSHQDDSEPELDKTGGRTTRPRTQSQPKADNIDEQECSLSSSDLRILQELKEENIELKKRLERKDEALGELQHNWQLEKDTCKSLETQLKAAQEEIGGLNREQETLINIFSEERERRDNEEKNLRKKLQEASNAIQELLDKVRLLESRPNSQR